MTLQFCQTGAGAQTVGRSRAINFYRKANKQAAIGGCATVIAESFIAHAMTSGIFRHDITRNYCNRSIGGLVM